MRQPLMRDTVKTSPKDNLIRHLKMNELKATMVLHELERAALHRELASAAPTSVGVAGFGGRCGFQDLEYRAAQNYLIMPSG